LRNCNVRCENSAKRKFLSFYSPEIAQKVTLIFTENLNFWMGLDGEIADAANGPDLQCVSIAVELIT